MLIASSSSSPTVDNAGLLGRLKEVSIRDRPVPLVIRFEVTRDNVMDRAVEERGEVSCASSNLCCIARELYL